MLLEKGSEKSFEKKNHNHMVINAFAKRQNKENLNAIL